jgi:hypothetical protein
MMTSCTSQYDFCITKGTDFSKDVALTASYQEVLDNPDDYQGVMVFRGFQDDAAPVYLTLIAAINTTDTEAPILMSFIATPVQTALLPDWDIVSYTNLELKTATSKERLFNSDVEIGE